MALGDLRYKALLTGDDYWADVIDEKPPYKASNGMMMKQYLIIPSEDLKDAYPDILKVPDVLNVRTRKGNAMWVEYPTIYVCDENPSRSNAIARVDCTFDGEPTPHTRRYHKYTARIQELEMENESLRVGTIVLQEEKHELMDTKLTYAQKEKEYFEMFQGGRRYETDEDEQPGP